MTSIPKIKISLQDYFTMPRAFWEVGGELFDEVMTAIAVDKECVCPFFNFFTIMYPNGYPSFPKFVTKRLGGTVGSTRQKQEELRTLARYEIVKKMPFDISGDLPGLYNTWPDYIGQTALVDNITVGRTNDDLILSIENSITRRNTNRCNNGIPTYVISRGKPVHDEFILILQIFRAKLILNK